MPSAAIFGAYDGDTASAFAAGVALDGKNVAIAADIGPMIRACRVD